MLAALFSAPTDGLGTAPTVKTRTVGQQMFNMPAYQRNRVTPRQLGELESTNKSRQLAGGLAAKTSYDRARTEAERNQRLNETQINDSAANQFFDMTQQYRQQQMSRMLPLLSQIFSGGF